MRRLFELSLVLLCFISSCSGATIIHEIINTYPEEMFFLAATGNYDEPLYMEAKAYCAARGYLSTWLMTRRDMEDLPVYRPDVNDTEAVINGVGGKNSHSSASLFQQFVQYNKFAMTVDAAESGLWANYTFRLSQTAKLNTTEYSETAEKRQVRTENANSFYKNNLFWLDLNGVFNARNLEIIQGRLNNRTIELNSGTYAAHIPGLDKLFTQNKFSKDLFTTETEAYVQSNKPRLSHANAYKFVSSFTVKGCAEQPKDNINNRIIIAIEGDLRTALIENVLLKEEDENV